MRLGIAVPALLLPVSGVPGMPQAALCTLQPGTRTRTNHGGQGEHLRTTNQRGVLEQVHGTGGTGGGGGHSFKRRGRRMREGGGLLFQRSNLRRDGIKRVVSIIGDEPRLSAALHGN